jgi:RNA polymerase sigma-70 factor (ECF subfamily)
MDPDPQTDGQRLAAPRRGDQLAFADLVERHEGAVLRHARALLGDWHGGEDVVQDVFLRLARKPPRLADDVVDDPRASRAVLSSWLHQVTRNLAMDTMRSEGRRRKREREASASEAVSGGLDSVEATDTKAAVERGLHLLPVDQREVLVLRLLEDKSYAEIAEITGRKVGTVGWLISVGLKALASELAPLAGMGGPGSESMSRSLQGGLS